MTVGASSRLSHLVCGVPVQNALIPVQFLSHSVYKLGPPSQLHDF